MCCGVQVLLASVCWHRVDREQVIKCGQDKMGDGYAWSSISRARENKAAIQSVSLGMGSLYGLGCGPGLEVPCRSEGIMMNSLG